MNRCRPLSAQSHVCVLQTTLDLLERGISVHVLADGVSSCNPEEIPVALNVRFCLERSQLPLRAEPLPLHLAQRMRDAGAVVSTSESTLFEFMGDASDPRFKDFSRFIKETKEPTKSSLTALVPAPKI